MKFSKLIIPSIIVAPLPFVFVVSCSSSGSETSLLEQTKQLREFFQSNPNSLEPLGTPIEIKNFVELRDWKNLNDLISEKFLGKYFVVTDSLKNKLSENEIYKKIKQVTIQPTPSSRNLDVIFYLNKITDDENVVNVKVENALTTPFSYPHEIIVPVSFETIKYSNQKEFDAAWEKVTNKDSSKIDMNELKQMLANAFGFDEENLEKITSNYINNKYFTIKKTNRYEIVLEITKEGLLEGFVFYKNQDNSDRKSTHLNSSHAQ